MILARFETASTARSVAMTRGNVTAERGKRASAGLLLAKFTYVILFGSEVVDSNLPIGGRRNDGGVV